MNKHALRAAMSGTAVPIEALFSSPKVSATASNKKTDLIVEINREHELAQSNAKAAVEHAVRCGQLLLEQKKRLEHGEFDTWIKTNCKFARSTATRYMTAAREIATGRTISSLSALFESGRPGYQKPATTAGAVFVPEPPKPLSKADEAAASDAMVATMNKVVFGTKAMALSAPTMEVTKNAVPVTIDQPALTIEMALEKLKAAGMGGSATAAKLVAAVRTYRSEVTKLQNKLKSAQTKLADADAAAIAAARELLNEPGARGVP